MSLKFIPLLSFAFFLLTACNGQIQSDKNVTTSNESANVPDVDPYFVETNAISSALGPKNITRNIIQDKKGNIWLASWEGIICYDGKTFMNYTLKENLRKYHIFSAFEDSKGNLWFGSIRGGVYRYDGKTFTNFTEKEGLKNWVECMIEDKKGNVWFATNEGVVRYDGNAFQQFSTKDGLIDDYVHGLLETKDGNIWIATTGGISIFNGKTFQNFNHEDGVPFENIRTLIQDQNGTVWIGGQEGLFTYDGKSIKKQIAKFAGYLYEDRKGAIWTCIFETEGKMTLLKKEANSDFVEVKKENGQIFGIVEDKDGNIWFGKEDGVSRYDGKSFQDFRE